MLYLKCTLCGFNNPVRSESILFCEGCNKKLQNNFRDWQKIHPELTFADFSKQFCVTEFDLATQTIPQKRKKSSLKIIAIIVGAFLVLLLLLGIGGYKIGKKFLDRSIKTETDQTILSKEWEKKQIGHSGLSLHLPFELTRQEMPIPENAKSLIDSMETYSHISDKGFKVIANITTYVAGLEGNVENAVRGSVTETQNVQGITDFRWNNSDIRVSGIRGIVTVMNYKLLSYPIEVKLLTVYKNNKLYQVITQYSEDDKTGKSASERIFSTVEIKVN